jgi:hypothetical protein
MKRHERDSEVCTRVLQRKRGGIGQTNIHRWISLASSGDEGRRRVDADDVMP